MVVGRMDADLGESVLRRGMADFIVMNRRLHADPELPNKLAAGHPEDIAPCTACNFCLGGAGRCRINGISGTVYTKIDKAEKTKNIVVIGGGPAGMEAARVSALRGHRVTLFEKSSKPGGLLSLAAMVKGSHPENLPELIRYFERQLEKLGVRVEAGREVDAAVIKTENPDAVFLASGGITRNPDIKGIKHSKVISGAELHKRLKFFSRFFGPETLRKLSRFYMPIGRKAVVIGGAVQGCELAEFLVKRGREVTLVDQAESLGEGLTLAMKEQLFRWFEEKRLPMISGVREYVEINEQGLVLITGDGKRLEIEADTVIPALPLLPNAAFLEELKTLVPEAHAVGDCSAPGLIVDAVGSAFAAARLI